MQGLSDHLDALRGIDNRFSNPETREREREQTLKKIKEMMTCLSGPLPWIGRILTTKKYYGGTVRKLNFKTRKGTLEFIIDNGAKYECIVPLNDLLDIQEFKTIDGKPLFIRNHNHKE